MTRFVVQLIAILPLGAGTASAAPAVLKSDAFKHHVEGFNAMEPEEVVNHIPDAGAWRWMTENVPIFECPDRDIERTY